jgi:hypothetical protein
MKREGEKFEEGEVKTGVKQVLGLSQWPISCDSVAFNGSHQITCVAQMAKML